MPRAAALVALAAAILPALAATTVEPLVDRRLVLQPGHMCGPQDRRYAPCSAYEANLRRLATTVAAEVSARPCNCSAGSVAGRGPDQVTAAAYCYWRPDASSRDCGACVALAFREARRLCPYHMRAVAVVDGGACSVSFREVQVHVRKIHYQRYNFIFRSGYMQSWWINQDVLVILLFQATGLACVVFLFIQEWRTRSTGPAIVPSIAMSTFLSPVINLVADVLEARSACFNFLSVRCTGVALFKGWKRSAVVKMRNICFIQNDTLNPLLQSVNQ